MIQYILKEGRMRKTISVIFVFLIVVVSICQATEIAGVNIPQSISINQQELILNGAGVRSKLLVKLYVGGLYLKQQDSDPQKIIQADEPMAIRLHIISSMITSKRMEDATREGFINSTKGNTGAIEERIDKFISVFKEQINENDVFKLIYTPGRGTEIHKNNETRAVIEGLDFKEALFGIWLCNKPAQKGLKKKMLGE
jgi:hypothetical protein